VDEANPKTNMTRPTIVTVPPKRLLGSGERLSTVPATSTMTPKIKMSIYFLSYGLSVLRISFINFILRMTKMVPPKVAAIIKSYRLPVIPRYPNIKQKNMQKV
jgi:hypothetical protein